MILKGLKSVYTSKDLHFFVIFFYLLITFIVIYYPITYANTNFEPTKKYTASNFLKQKEPGLSNNLSSVNHYIKKRSPHLLTENGNESSLWSNAFNFKKTIDTQTDPRTGMLSAHIKVGSLISNEGHGPDIDLEANYNSGTTANPDGIGYGWSWNLTHFNPLTNQLTTS
ncbi:MAG: hypothetical protein OXC48_03395, partial [Endozoicomonadaceae bacterium]|nr:hypothetical protein [Endozoicomonadaceae bacterium]